VPWSRTNRSRETARGAPVGGRATFAVSIDLDPVLLQEHYPCRARRSAEVEITDALRALGYEPRPGGLFVGNRSVDAVSCVLAVQELARVYPWFVHCALSVNMLRISEISDLLPAVTATGTFGDRLE